MKVSRTEFVDAYDMRLCVRHWGDESAPKLFMIHGWMDISASFQFVVDAFKCDWHVIAPDMRGFGHSGWQKEGTGFRIIWRIWRPCWIIILPMNLSG